jgi:hypothetical protein
MADKIVAYRYIRETKTKTPVGPLVPVYKSDWPYQSIAPDQIVWRYLDFWKFEEMLKKSALYFRRADCFKDPLEGSLSIPEIHGTSASDKAFHSTYGTRPDYESRYRGQNIMKSCVFVNCWHRNTRESERMWKEYTATAESVVITSSARALQRVLPQTILVSPVKYIPQDFPRTEFDHSSLFFYKDTSFTYERELRLLRHLGENEILDIQEDIGKNIPINLKLLIHRVVLNKRIPDRVAQHVINLVKAHCPRAIVQRSILQ